MILLCRYRLAIALVAFVAVDLGVSQAASAAEISGSVGPKLRLDSNIFALPSDEIVTGGRGATVVGADVRVDAEAKPGDFTFRAAADAGYDVYQNKSRLNNFNYALTANISRDPGPRIGLDFGVISRRQLSSFANIGGIDRNITQYTEARGRAVVPVTSELGVVVNSTFSSNTNQSVSLNGNDFHRYGGGVGLEYFTPLGNSIALTVNRNYIKGFRERLPLNPGELPLPPINLVDTAPDLRLRYRISDFTAIRANISLVFREDRNRPGFTQRNPVGEFSIDFIPRPTFGITASVGQRLSTQDTVLIANIRDTYASFNARAIVASRLSADFTASGIIRKFQPASDVAVPPPSVSTQRMWRLEAGASYLIGDRINLGIQASHDQRHSSYQPARYSATAVQITIRLLFGKWSADVAHDSLVRQRSIR